jgi:hypothetical protein
MEKIKTTAFMNVLDISKLIEKAASKDEDEADIAISQILNYIRRLESRIKQLETGGELMMHMLFNDLHK